MKRPHYRKSTIPEDAKRVFEGVMFDVYQWEQKLYDGSMATFEKLARADTAVVFPILDDGRILLIRDEQPGKVMERGAPSGRVEPGETPQEAALRELEEETGYRAESLVPLYPPHAPSSKIDWFIYVYVGKNCKKVAEPRPEPGERIELVPSSFDELIAFATEEATTYHYGYFSKMAYDAIRNPEKMNELRKLFSND